MKIINGIRNRCELIVLLMLCLIILSGCSIVEAAEMNDIRLGERIEETETEGIEWNSNYDSVMELLNGEGWIGIESSEDKNKEVELFSITHSFVEDKARTHINFNVGFIVLDENGEILESVKYSDFDAVKQMKQDGIMMQEFYQSEWFSLKGFVNEDVENYFNLRYEDLDVDERKAVIKAVLNKTEIDLENENIVFTDEEIKELMELIDEWSMERILDSDYWFDGEKGEWELYKR